MGIAHSQKIPKNITINKHSLIQKKSVFQCIVPSQNSYSFTYILPLNLYELLIISTTSDFFIYSLEELKVKRSYKVSNIKVMRKITGEDNSFYAGIISANDIQILKIQINFDDYSMEMNEVIKYSSPKNAFLNFICLDYAYQADTFVVGLTKGLIRIFQYEDKEDINNENKFKGDDDFNLNNNYYKKSKTNDNIKLQNKNTNNNILNFFVNSSTMSNNNNITNELKKANTNAINDNDYSLNSTKINKNSNYKLLQSFTFQNKLMQNENPCGFLEINESTFICKTSEGSIRFFDYQANTQQYKQTNFLQGNWANPNIDDNIILYGTDKLICVFLRIVIIDVNKRYILQQIKPDIQINCICLLFNKTVIVNSLEEKHKKKKDKEDKKNIIVQQFIVEENTNENNSNNINNDIMNVKANNGYNSNTSNNAYDKDNQVLNFNNVGELIIKNTKSSLTTKMLEINNQIILFSSKMIHIIGNKKDNMIK